MEVEGKKKHLEIVLVMGGGDSVGGGKRGRVDRDFNQ